MESRIFQIGKWRVEPAANTLRSGHEVVRLQPRFMRVLAVLEERRGEVLTRRELLDEVWEDVVVEDAALTQAISHIRSALGPVEGASIETIPKVGYRLAAPAPDTSVEFAEQDSRTSKWPQVAIGSLAVFGLIVVIGALGRLGPNHPAGFTTSRITSDEGLELWPAINPAGTVVAYSKASDGRNYDLYVQHVDSAGRATRLTRSTSSDVHPQWSPDAAAILFARRDANSCRIMLVASDGSQERPLLDCAPASWPTFAWSPDGERIAVSILDEATGEYAIHILDAETLEPTVGPVAEPGVSYRRPVFTGTDELAFVAYEEGYTGSIRMLRTDGLQARSQTEEHADPRVAHLFSFTGPINGLAFQSRDRRFLVAGERDAEPDVFRADFSGNGSWQRLNAAQPSADAAGAHVVLTQWQNNANIYSIDLSAHYTVRKYEEVLKSTQVDRSPRWSNSRDRIAFVSSRTGAEALWVAGFDGRLPLKIYQSETGRIEDFDWSADDREIVLVAARDGRRELLITRVPGSRADDDSAEPPHGETRVLIESDLDPQSPSWSSNGSRIYFLGGSGDERAILAVSPEGSGLSKVGLPGADFAIQGSDGTLFFTRSDSAGIWMLEPGDDARQKAPERLVDDLHGNNWDLAGGSVYYVRKVDASHLDILSLDIDSRRTQFHDRIQAQLFPGRSFDVSPRQKHVLLAVVQRTESDVIMVSERRGR